MYYISPKASARKAYARITRSRITTSFFIFTLTYLCVQCVLQSLVFSLDNEYATFVSRIIKAGNLPPQNFTYIQPESGHLLLQMCDDIPFGKTDPCTTIYDSSMPSVQYEQSASVRVLHGWKQGLQITSIPSFFNITPSEVLIWTDPPVVLTGQCVEILTYPYQILTNFTNEEITWLCLQIWLVIVSFFVLLNDSVPHTLAALMTHALEAGWAVYATWRGPTYQANFQKLTAQPGSPCSLDLFSAYWKQRHVFEISDAILSGTGLIVFSYLSWKLLKVYNAQSFKCVGAPQHVMRIHKFFMAVLACLQLEVFVLVTSLGLWSKALSGTAMAHISAHTPLYKALYIGTIILLLPWIAMGWYSIRREMKIMMIVFLGLAFLITAVWAIMFYSMVYRWTYLQWPYLACYTMASFVLLIASMILGIICRMNFGKGLAHYLQAEATLASQDFPSDEHPSTIHRGMELPQSVDWDMKILAKDGSHSPPLYLVSLPNEDWGQ